MDIILEEVTTSDSIDVVIVSAYWAFRGVPEHELSSVLGSLAQEKSLFLVDDLPEFPFSPVKCLLGVAPLVPSKICEMPSNFEGQDQWAASEALQRIANGIRGVELLRPRGAICDKDVCRMSIDGQLLYRDRDHLNAHGSRVVATWLAGRYAHFADALTE
jgi:hypothetical protein